MPTSREYYQRKIREVWVKTRTTLKEKNTNLAVLRDIIISALPEEIKVESKDNEAKITFTNSNGQGLILKRDINYRISCWFPETMYVNFHYNLQRIEPKSIARFASDLFTSLPAWFNEYNALKIKEFKRSKIKSIAEKNIEILIDETMKDLKYQYYTEKQETKVVLNIKIRAKRKLEIPISHNRFVEQIPLLADTIMKFHELCNQNDFKVLICNYGNNSNWKEGGSHTC